MSIRRASLTDLDSIVFLLDQLGGYPQTASFLPEKLPSLLNNASQYIFVYEHDGNVVGLVSAQIIPELGLQKDTMLITYLVVNNLHRSSGVGKQLEQHCCDLAIRNNCGRIQLHCSKRRTRAQNFYQSLGYVDSPTCFSKQLQ